MLSFAELFRRPAACRPLKTYSRNRLRRAGVRRTAHSLGSLPARRNRRRDGCARAQRMRKSCLMKILSGSLKAGFCSMRIDGKWHRRFTEKGDSLPSAASVHSRMVAAGTRARRFRAAKGRPGTVVSGVHSLRGTRIGGAVGRGTADSGMFSSSCAARPRFILLDEPFSQIAPCTLQRPNTHPAGKGHERDFAHRPHVPPRDRHCRPVAM